MSRQGTPHEGGGASFEAHGPPLRPYHWLGGGTLVQMPGELSDTRTKFATKPRQIEDPGRLLLHLGCQKVTMLGDTFVLQCFSLVTLFSLPVWRLSIHSCDLYMPHKNHRLILQKKLVAY